jgi:hypothetical protein
MRERGNKKGRGLFFLFFNNTYIRAPFYFLDYFFELLDVEEKAYVDFFGLFDAGEKSDADFF